MKWYEYEKTGIAKDRIERVVSRICGWFLAQADSQAGDITLF